MNDIKDIELSVGIDDHRKYMYQPYEEMVVSQGISKAKEAIKLDVDNVFSMIMHEYEDIEAGQMSATNMLMLLQSGLVRPLQMYFMLTSVKLEPFVFVDTDNVTHLGLKNMDTEEQEEINVK